MNILLDTNALIYILDSADSSELGPQAKLRIAKADRVFMSTISLVEINIKVMLGKLVAPPKLLEAINAAGIKELPFDFSAAEAIKNFPKLIRHDPFDRMILSQAEAGGLRLLTADKVLLSLNLPYVIDART